MKLSQNQNQRTLLVKATVATGVVGIIAFLLINFTGLFKSEESLAIPANAADFSETCYSIADGGAGLFEFNKYNGNPSNLGNTGISSPEASSLNLIGDSLFVIDGSNELFGFVNLVNGGYTELKSNLFATSLNGEDGSIQFDDVDAMTVDNNDVFWVASRDNNDTDPSYIAQMDHQGNFIKNAFGTGIDYVKFKGPEGFPSVLDAMGYDPIEDVLYVSANDGSGNPTYNNLMSVNISNGVGTFVGNFTIGDVEGLGFDGEGNMYATTGANASSSADLNSFFSINKRTAVATKVFTFSGETDFETCDCIIGFKNTIKGKVFFDADENSYIGSGEAGYPGVTVSLYYDENNNGVYDQNVDGFVRSTTTNAYGEYVLYDAYEYGTMNYVVNINTGDLPSGSSLTTDNIESASFSSGSNTDYHNDFGYKLGASSKNDINGYVYMDADQDQTFDGSENGIDNVTVYLYQDLNGNGTYQEGIDELLQSQETDDAGYYSFSRPFEGGCTLLELTTTSGGDVEETNGTLSTSSSDLDIGESEIGIIFESAGIPQGAEILEAYVQFTSSSTNSSVNYIEFYGEDVDQPNSYSNSNKVTTRTKTTAKAEWYMPYWSATGIDYTTPSVKEIIQEIVNRSGWSSGNDINIMTTSSSGNRAAVSRDNSASDAPKLFIKYKNPSVADAYLTFVEESTTPAASTFTTDNIENASFTSGGNVDADNNFGLYQDPGAVNLISGTVFYDANSDATNNSGDVGEPFVTVCLFDDVNGNGTYESNTDLLLEIVKTDANGYYEFERAYNGASTESINRRVSQDSDDARDNKDKSELKNDKNELKIGKEANTIRFTNLDIPQGATITNAYMRFTAKKDKSGNFSTEIEGIDVDNASTFSNNQNPNTLARTNASVTWSDNTSWDKDDVYNSPSLVGIAQEIVNRSGWTLGGSLAFIMNDGSGERQAYAYDNSSTKATELVIEYEGSDVNYVVIIKEDNLPNGQSMTTDNIEAASFSSGGNHDQNNDFGYELNTQGMNTITGTVYQDQDQDQIKDGNENRLSGITVKLIDDLNCNGTVDSGEPVLSSATTNANGEYTFNEGFDQLVETRIGSSSDDIDESPVSTSSSDLDIAEFEIGLRFNNLNIPQGAQIGAAYIEFTAEADKSGSFSVTVEGIDQNSVSTFSNSQNLNALPRTSASATFSGSQNWVLDESYQTTSLTGIVQELVNRSGWTTSSAMGFILSSGSGDKDAYSYDQDPSKAPKLVIEFTPSSKCYVVEIPNSSMVQQSSLTTPSTRTSSFNTSNQTDPNNDFGLYYAPLPVEMVRFDGAWEANMVKLTWKTATEINNDYFEVQWSKDGMYYEPIGSVEGNGTTPVGADYEYVHNYPEELNYYRLKQMDYDGEYAYSSVIMLTKNGSDETTVSAYPNPCVDQLNINITASIASEAVVQIQSYEGRLVFESVIMLNKGVQSIPVYQVANFPTGTYIVAVKTATGLHTTKIIKN